MSGQAVSITPLREGTGERSGGVGARSEASAALRVAFQGEPGAFSEEAVREYFGTEAVPVPCREFRHVGEAVRAGETEYALLPIENTLVGAVVGSYDVLAGGELEVIGEVIRPIRHFLLGVPGAVLAGVRRVLSHPVALAQCTHFLAAHPEIEAVAVHDTAGAAREVAERGDPTIAAIAPRGAADRYGLEPIAGDLQDRSDNQTRFLALVRRETPEQGVGEVRTGSARGDRDEMAVGTPAPPVGGAGSGGAESGGAQTPGAAATSSTIESGDAPERDSGPWKSMLIAEMDNQPGALVALLAPFAERGVNLSALECRPGGEPWTYRFFIELTTDLTAGEARAALEEASARAVRLITLGVFRPAAVG